MGFSVYPKPKIISFQDTYLYLQRPYFHVRSRPQEGVGGG